MNWEIFSRGIGRKWPRIEDCSEHEGQPMAKLDAEVTNLLPKCLRRRIMLNNPETVSDFKASVNSFYSAERHLVSSLPSLSSCQYTLPIYIFIFTSVHHTCTDNAELLIILSLLFILVLSVYSRRTTFVISFLLIRTIRGLSTAQQSYYK